MSNNVYEPRKDMVELTVRVIDNSEIENCTFDTSVKFPLCVNEQDRNSMISSWIELINKALTLARKDAV